MSVGTSASALPSSAAVSPDTSVSRPKRRLSRKVAADMVAIGDFLAVFLGGLLPALIYAVIGNVEINQILVLQSTLIAAFITHLCLRYRGMYDTSKMSEFPQSPAELLIAILCGLVAVIGIGLPLALQNMHLVVWFAAWVSASLFLILFSRLVSRRILASYAAQGRFDERVAVFGAGNIARRVHDYLQMPSLGVYFSGVYDDRIGQDRINPEGLVVEGRLDELIAQCREGRIDRVVVALPQSASDRIAGIIAKLDPLPVATHIVTHITSDLLETDTDIGVSSLGPIGLLDVKKKH